MRLKAKTDSNHAEIRDGLRSIPGVTVADTSSAGHGFPDLVVGFQKQNYLIEIKDGSKTVSRRKLTPDQVEFHNAWKGQICTVCNFDEALEVIGIKLKPNKTK